MMASLRWLQIRQSVVPGQTPKLWFDAAKSRAMVWRGFMILQEWRAQAAFDFGRTALV
jgi:hypothetical protein